MKKALTVIISVLLLSFPFLLTACSRYDETFSEISDNYADLASKAEFSVSRGSGDCETVLRFGKTVTFNRLVLREKTDTVTSFSLRLPDSPLPFYGNDFIGGYRYCSFPSVTTDTVILSLHAEGAWSLSEPEAYYIPAHSKPFSVTSYITAKAAYSLSSSTLPTDTFDIVYSAYLDKDGNIRLPDYYIDDKRIDGEEVLATCVANIRALYPKARILATVLGDREFDDDGLTLQQRCSSAFSNAEVLSSSLLGLVDRYGIDGISFDYEYPLSKSDYSLFADFCAFFRKNLPENKLLTAAVSAWCVDEKRLGKTALSCFDRITLMAYDDTDARGCHSTFYSAYSQLKRLKSRGVPLNKIQLGLPLYSKPLDGSDFNAIYADYAQDIPLFCNTAYADCGGQLKPCYFNGRQLISDKTSLALDIGLCGTAVWHYSLDSRDPALSLLATIERTVNPRQLPRLADTRQ